MPGGNIRALLVGGSKEEYSALHEMLEAEVSFHVQLEHSVDLDTGVQSLQEQQIDVVLLDLGVSDRHGFETLTMFRGRTPQTPIIVLLDEEDNQTATTLMQIGAQDYLTKGSLSTSLLSRSIRYSIGQMQSQKDLILANTQVVSSNHALERAISNTTRLVREAEASDVAMTRFLTDLNYDITTPINGIIPMIGVLLETELDQEQRELAQMISNSSDALLLILHDVINSSRLDTGTLELEAAPFELRTALEEQNNLLALRAHDKGLEYACLIAREVPSYVIGDSRHLREILNSIVDNAIKFTREGEIVLNLSVDNQDDSQVCLRFTVNYTGGEASREKIESLLEENVHMKNSGSAKPGSARSGLGIAKQLVELMGGEIGVVSEPGADLTLWFTAILKKQALDQTPAEKIAEILRDVRVLVVDDSATVRKVCDSMLSTWGCRCHESKDASSALQVLRAAVEEKDTFDVVLIDTGLEGIGGEGLGEVIRSDSSLDNLSLILMTSLTHRGEAFRLKSRGFHACLTKPLRRKQLYDSIVMALGRDSKIDSATDAALKTEHPGSDHPKRKTHILVVEDNLVNQQVASKLLAKFGYEADLVEDGLEAIRALMTVRYDVVLMDVLMPRMDGIEATRIIRDPNSAVKDHDVPIIALTADTILGSKERCLGAGMDDFIPKPIVPEKLERLIEKWSRKSAQ